MTTLQLSLLNQGDMTSLPEDFPAKTYQAPTPTGEGWKVSEVDYFTNSCELFASADPVTLYWKTSQRCFQSKMGELWDQFFGRFPKAGMMRNGRLYQRQAWVRCIYAKECSLLPTPKALMIEESVEQWQIRRAKPGNKMMGCSLAVAVKMLPTPTSLDRSDTILGALIRDQVTGQLNPQWVEWLMGFPEGWTELED